MLIDPDAFEACFSAWAQSCAEAFDREVVAIDGKTLRRSLTRPGAGAAAPGQRQRAGPGARPARGRWQVERDHRDPGAARDAGLEEPHRDVGCHGLPEDDRWPDPRPGCRLPVGAQHSKAFLAVKEWALFCPRRHGKPVFDAFDDSHGPPARVRLPASPSLEALRAWPGLRTVLAVETIRGVNGSGKVEAEIRYFLSSCRDDPAVLVQAIRRHIENGLHWVLDVTFREDEAASGIARRLATWPSCARSPSTSWAGTEHPGSACGRVASRPPGTMITCSLFWLDNFMREGKLPKCQAV